MVTHLTAGDTPSQIDHDLLHNSPVPHAECSNKGGGTEDVTQKAGIGHLRALVLNP